jgi:hypothetical protein
MVVSSFSLWEKVGMRGLKSKNLVYPLTLDLSATAPALPYYLHPYRHPFGRGDQFYFG